MKWLAILIAAVAAASCSSGQPTYLNGVQPLGPEQAHPLFVQLLPVLEKPEGRSPDELIRTWKQFLDGAPTPLRSDSTFTFVYYDFTHQLKQVFLEASFSPQRKEGLTRVGSSSLFFGVYKVPKPQTQRYRFSTGAEPLTDPFQPNLVEDAEPWHPMVTALTAEPSTQWIAGASETALEGQDLSIVLPPGYSHNLAQSYPLVVVVGLQGRSWSRPVLELLREGAMRPVIVASVGEPSGLKAVLEERVVPWMRTHYRASPQAADLVLIGWGPSAKTVQDLAAARPDFWSKTWTPLADQARGEEAWTTLAPPFFRTQFSVVIP